MAISKRQWQINRRNQFKSENGYSMTTDYRFGGLRRQALERDGYACVKCGMTDEQHRARWSRPITVDHIDRDKSHNALDNFQTLCLSCHGRKDILPHLIIPKCVKKKRRILSLRSDGKTYQQIADAVGFSIGAIYKWVQRWKGNENERTTA